MYIVTQTKRCEAKLQAPDFQGYSGFHRLLFCPTFFSYVWPRNQNRLETNSVILSPIKKALRMAFFMKY